MGWYEFTGNMKEVDYEAGNKKEAAIRVWSWGPCIPQSDPDDRYWKGHQIKEVNSEVC